MWTKTLPDGTKAQGPTVEGPGFSLGPEDRVGQDGWVWVDDSVTPVVEVSQDAIDQLAQDTAVATTPIEYDAAIEAFLGVIQ